MARLRRSHPVIALALILIAQGTWLIPELAARTDQIIAGIAGGTLDLALTYDMALEREDVDWTEIARLPYFLWASLDNCLILTKIMSNA